MLRVLLGMRPSGPAAAVLLSRRCSASYATVAAASSPQTLLSMDGAAAAQAPRHAWVQRSLSDPSHVSLMQ